MGCDTPEPSITYQVPGDEWSPRKVGRVGYSCQVHLAQTLREHYDRDKAASYYAWFATELNPQTVDLTSRPLHIYKDLDIAVKLGSKGHPKIKTLREKLQAAVDSNVADDAERGRLKSLVGRAELPWFRPVLVKIDLTGVDLAQCRADAIMGGATSGEGRDEYLAKEIHVNNCWVIVE